MPPDRTKNIPQLLPADPLTGSELLYAVQDGHDRKVTTQNIAGLSNVQITAAQAFAIQRANHTGTQLASTISDFSSAVNAIAAVKSVAGRTGDVTLSHLDISGLGTLATQSGTFSGTSSGTNTGDETASSIKTKLGITTLSGSNTGDQDLSGYLTISSAGTTYHPLENQRLGSTNTVTFASVAIQAVDFSTTAPLAPHVVGRVRWNDTDKCVEYDTVDGSTIQLGQETTIYARNESGILLANGKAVVVTGSVGQRMTFGLAANTHISAQKTIGLVTTPNGISNNGFGLVTVFGLVRDVDTGDYNEGDELWLSSNGNYSTTIPTTEGQYVVRIGFVIRANHSTGSIFVAPHYHGTTTGFALTEATSQSAARTALGLGTLATQSGTFSGTSSGTNTGDQNTFKTIAVTGQTSIVAGGVDATLTIAGGSNITVTTDALTSTLTIAANGGSASATTFTPVGNIEATDVQSALQEVDSEKQTKITYSDTAPLNPQEKDEWYDTSSTGRFIYYSGAWVEVSGAAYASNGSKAQDNPPTTVNDGDLWYDTSTGGLYVYTSGTWVEAQGNAIDSAGIIAALGYTPVNPTRTLNTTFPLRIDGGSSGTLELNRTLSVSSATTTTSGIVPGIGGTILSNVTDYHSAMDRIRVVPVTSQTMANAATGTGAVGGEPGSMRYGGTTGATANSTLRFYPNNNGNSLQQALHDGDANTTLNFNVRWAVQFAFSCDSQHSTATTYYMLGIAAATAYGAPTTKSVGVRIVNGTMVGFAHDGTTLRVTGTLATVNATTIRRIKIECATGGVFNFFLDGSVTSNQTISNGPTGISANSGETFVCSFTNGANSSSNRAFLYDLKCIRLH